MADRQRVRVGRGVTYFPTDAEASAGGSDDGAAWIATIGGVNSDGSVNLNAIRGDGTELAFTDIPRGIRKGEFDLTGGVAHNA